MSKLFTPIIIVLVFNEIVTGVDNRAQYDCTKSKKMGAKKIEAKKIFNYAKKMGAKKIEAKKIFNYANRELNPSQGCGRPSFYR